MTTVVNVAISIILLNVSPRLSELQSAPHLDALTHNKLAALEVLEIDAAQRVRAKVLWSNISGLPAVLEFNADSTRSKKLSAGSQILVPLKKVGHGWHLYRNDLTGIAIRRTVRPLAHLNELKRWQEVIEAPSDTQARIVFVDLVDSPLEMVSEAAQELLIIKTKFTPLDASLVQRLGEKLYDRSLDKSVRNRRLRFIETVGRGTASNWLSGHLFTRLPAHLRSAAIGTLGRHSTPRAIRTLTQCAVSNRVGLANVCRHWLGTGEPKMQ